MISTKSLRIDYDDVTAVCDLDLEIRPGQIYGLVGPNGAGKTSTLKALAGILEPTYGEIKINGYDFELDHEKALQQVGFMPDFPPVYENLKVWEYLDVFGAAYLLSTTERSTRSKYWVEQVNLQEKWDALIRDLSRGMRQRLILAKTLLHDPKVLILDEPASGLDPIARKDFQNILKRVAADGKTIIISSHILTELSDFCNAIGIMEKGRMVVSGSIEDIRNKIGSKGKVIIHFINGNAGIKNQLQQLLSQAVHLQNLRENADGSFEASFTGNDQDASDLLNQLLKAKIPICSFHLKKEDVEDIFFKIGANEAS